MDTTNFLVNPNGHCSASEAIPDQKSIKLALSAIHKKHLQTNMVIIARYRWMKRKNISYPENMELPNLCLMIKDGKLTRAFYSNVLTHIIKKQNYFIKILN